MTTRARCQAQRTSSAFRSYSTSVRVPSRRTLRDLTVLVVVRCGGDLAVTKNEKFLKSRSTVLTPKSRARRCRLASAADVAAGHLPPGVTVRSLCRIMGRGGPGPLLTSSCISSFVFNTVKYYKEDMGHGSPTTHIHVAVTRGSV